MSQKESPIEPTVVTNFLRSKQDFLSLDDDDIQKFGWVLGSKFFNLTEEVLTCENCPFRLEPAKARCIAHVVNVLNQLCDAAYELNEFDVSLESAVQLLKDLGSEGKMSGEALKAEILKYDHLLDDDTRG